MTSFYIIMSHLFTSSFRTFLFIEICGIFLRLTSSHGSIQLPYNLLYDHIIQHVALQVC